MGARKIVTIVLDCGHTRTWDLDATKERYSKTETTECEHCGLKENIHKVIDKAHAA